MSCEELDRKAFVAFVRHRLVRQAGHRFGDESLIANDERMFAASLRRSGSTGSVEHFREELATGWSGCWMLLLGIREDSWPEAE